MEMGEPLRLRHQPDKAEDQYDQVNSITAKTIRRGAIGTAK